MTFTPTPRPEPVLEGYPCPDCVHTMLPGMSYNIYGGPGGTGEQPTKGAGKVYNYYTSGAAQIMPGPAPTPTLIDCYRCQGTGYVADRRRSATRRKNVGNRRA